MALNRNSKQNFANKFMTKLLEKSLMVYVTVIFNILTKNNHGEAPKIAITHPLKECPLIHQLVITSIIELLYVIKS